ncbi:MAG: sulfotransferase [Actinomycetota bacterium]
MTAPVAPALLVTGVPRSGTTWVANVLRRAEGALYIHEPDTENVEPYALEAKRTLGRYPALLPGDEAPAYESLWLRALQGNKRERTFGQRAAKRLLREASESEVRHAYLPGGRPSLRLRAARRLAVPPSDRHAASLVIVKSVFSALALEWIEDRFTPRVLVVRRNLLNVLASWIDLAYEPVGIGRDPRVREAFVEPLGMPPPPSDRSALAETSWEVALLDRVLAAQAERHPEWLVVSHDDLCIDPRAAFQDLYGRLGLAWSPQADRFIEDSNAEGRGYSLKRVTRDQPESWRSRLNDKQVEEIRSVLAGFSHST